eukprot:g10013.t1
MKAHRDAYLEELRKEARERYLRILVETGSSCTMPVDEVLEYPDAFHWELLYPGTGLANFRIWCRLCGKEVSDGAKHGHLASKGHLEKWEQYIRCGSAGMPLKPMPPKAEGDSSALVSRGGTGRGVGRDGSNGRVAMEETAGYPDPNGLEEGLNEAEIKIIAETKGIIECPPVDMMRDPQVFRTSNRSTSERLDEKWSLDAAIAENGPARFLDDVVNEDIATDLDRVNMFSAYNQLPFERLGSYLQKLSAVLGQDMDVQHYSSGVSAYAGPKDGPEEKSCIFTGARMFDEGKGLLSSGRSVYSDAKTHKIAKSAVGASSAAGHSLAGSSAGVPSLFDGGDRESIYSRASTSGNTFLNLKKKPSKVWNDHRCVSYLAKQTGAVSGQSFHFEQPRQYGGGVQVPYEWCIFVPVQNDRAAGSGLRMFCTLCEKGTNDPTNNKMNHTTDGPNEHLKNLKSFQTDQWYRERSRRRRWKLIREHSPMFWEPKWHVDELAELRAKGPLAVYCSLYHLEQFAVRTALTRGQEILKDHIDNKKFTKGQVMRQMAKYTDEEEKLLFAIYHRIAFEGKWEQYITPSDRMTDEDVDEEMLEREALNVDDFRQNSAAEEANQARGGA